MVLVFLVFLPGQVLVSYHIDITMLAGVVSVSPSVWVAIFALILL